MIFIEYPKCSTCQKAKKWLMQQRFTFGIRHIVDKNPSYEELKEWHEMSGLDIKRFFNTSGQVYKQMQLKDKLPSMSLEEKLRLLSENGMLVKRPILVDGQTILVGFKQEEWQEVLLDDEYMDE